MNDIKYLRKRKNTDEYLKIDKIEDNNICYKSTKDCIEVALPVRVNFGGGWTDTPPYCLENGGSVLNAAFLLNNELPIKCKIYRTNDKMITLKSKDLNFEKKFTKIDELKNYDKEDKLSLIKSVLRISNIVRDEDETIENIVNRINGGICIETDATIVPKESGLGTSSILAAASLMAIYQFFNIQKSKEDICYEVLQVEQLMGTCGGWQDQIGGVFPGIKHTTTKTGKIQKFEIKSVKISNEILDELNKRFVLIYTGESKRAEKLLKTIMGKYLMEDKEVCYALKQIKNISYEMKNSLEEYDFEKFCVLMNKHWELSKSLDKNCTSDTIEKIFEICKDLIAGKMICGAGGRGFLQVMLKKGVSKNDIDEKLRQNFKDEKIQVYEVKLC